MKRQAYILRLLEILVPLLFLVSIFGIRFRRLPEWSQDIYPFVLWPLLAIVLVLAIVYLVDSKMGKGSPFLVWAWLAMSAGFAAFYFSNTTGQELPWFVVQPLLALLLILLAVIWARTWMTGS